MKTSANIAHNRATAKAKAGINAENNTLDWFDPVAWPVLYELRIKGYCVDVSPFMNSLKPSKSTEGVIWKVDRLRGSKYPVGVMPPINRIREKLFTLEQRMGGAKV